MINTAVILGGGLGIRMLPITRAIPKSLIMVGNKPVIEHILDELYNAGISNLIIVTNRGNQALKDYFTISDDIKKNLERSGKTKDLEEMQKKISFFKTQFVDQNGPLGGADALIGVKNYIEEESFITLLPDDLIWPVDKGISDFLRQYPQNNETVLFVRKIEKEEFHDFETIKFTNITNNIFNVLMVLEKSLIPYSFPSFGLLGRYVFTKDIFSSLEEMNRLSKNSLSQSELLISSAVNHFISSGKTVKAYCCDDVIHFDIGTEDNLIKANLYWISKYYLKNNVE